MSAGAMYASSTRRRALGARSAAWGCKAALKCGHTGTGPVHSLQRPTVYTVCTVYTEYTGRAIPSYFHAM
eukprot:353238-Chlamydomonas_euryale.AAC.1